MFKRSLVISVLLFLLSASTVAQVNTESLRSQRDSEGLFQEISLSTSFFGGNTDFFSMSGTYRIDKITKEYEAFFTTDFTQSERDGESIKNLGFLHGRYIHALNPNWLEVFAQSEWDEFNDLQYRNLIGAGLRFNLNESEETSFYVGVGVMAEFEDYDDSSFQERIRSTNYISFNQDFGHWSYRTINYIQPTLDNLSDVRSVTDHEIAFKFSKSLQFIFNVQGRYDSDPPAGIEELNYRLRQSIRWLIG